MSKESDQAEQLDQKELYRIVQMRDERGARSTIVGSLIGFLAFLCVLYGILSYQRPEVILIMAEKPVALAALLLGAGVILVTFTMMLSSLGRSSFERAPDAEASDTTNKTAAPLVTYLMRAIGALAGLTLSVNFPSEDVQPRELEPKVDKFSYGAASSETSFERYMTNVLGSLSAYSLRSEETATKLLGKGVAFMAGGLFFYVVAIVLWQVFANLLKPDEKVMYVGMAACSMTFIVIEFLAAWFFKQYRYYVEISMACMRVRSAYDRQLLVFYAQRSVVISDGDKNTDGSAVPDPLMVALQKDVNWPSYKAGKENDFNYMIETLGVMHTSLEKMKGFFQPVAVKDSVENEK